jgi:hypothetical protein
MSERPTALEIYIGSFAGTSYGLWWDGDQLVYEAFERGYEDRAQLVIQPSTAQWRRFWQTVESVGVWNWGERYEAGTNFEPRGVVRDGTHWSVGLTHGERSVESSGDSAGPGSSDLDESRALSALLEAVSRLIGGRSFA